MNFCFISIRVGPCDLDYTLLYLMTQWYMVSLFPLGDDTFS